jgi:hypothetical protein
VARRRVINNGQNQNLIGGNFFNVASETVFNLGTFKVETNLAGRRTRRYGNELSSFARPITLETIQLNDEDSDRVELMNNKVVLNLDRSDIKNFARFGSASEIFRVSVRNIISTYPASLYADPQTDLGGSTTVFDYSYNPLDDTALFKIPSRVLSNDFGLIFDLGNQTIPDENELKNLNISFSRYVVYRPSDPTDNSHNLIGFTGDSPSRQFITVRCLGNPFDELTGTTALAQVHLKPNVLDYNRFYTDLNDLEQFLISNRLDDNTGYVVKLKGPRINQQGDVRFSDVSFKWPTTDGYNLDITGAGFDSYLNGILGIGTSYDDIKTDLVARLLTPSSIKVYDETNEGKITKLLRIYGREFDEIKRFIDSLVYINRTTYDKKENVPDILVKNLARSFGWDTFNLVEETDLVQAFFSDTEEQSEDVLLPPDIDIELWRRIIINTNYFWKSKGTRAAIKSIFLLIGIPEPFINITEYVYTVDGRINPDTVTLDLADLPSATLPYNSQGFPIAPAETNDFFFQISGDTDSGQEYINLYRRLGFQVNRTVDNKKSWPQAGIVERIDDTTPNYFQQDSQLIINTKEIDITLDLARGIEYDVYCYNKDVDEPLTSSAVTRPYIYVNVPFEYGVSANTFTIPETPLSGSAIQVNFNGITLTSGGTGQGDYTRVNDTTVQLNDQVALEHSNGDRDEITLTYLHDRLDSAAFQTVKYIVTAPVVNANGTVVDLGEEPLGDIQLVVNGVSLTKGTTLFTGDFIIDPNDRTKIIIQNTELQLYLQSNPVVRIWYIVDDGETTVRKQSEAFRVDSFNSSKLFFDPPNYVYTMNYTGFDGESIKVTLNGITLQNGRDFTLNPNNKKQIKFKTSVNINFGDVIGVYYIIGTGTTPPLLPQDDTFPPVSDLSFLEYLELIQRRLINVRNRKVISNFNGGYYPTVLQLYEEYVRRSFLPSSDPLVSNGYTFENLYPFINQYNAFFTRFINQLMPATIILRKAGIMIRNTSFTRQKFMYRRGVNFDPNLQYLGDDSAIYKKVIPSGSCEWTDDFVCEFVPPPTTTTTTLPPPTTTTTTTLAPPPTTTTTTLAPTTTTTTTQAPTIGLLLQLTQDGGPTAEFRGNFSGTILNVTGQIDTALGSRTFTSSSVSTTLTKNDNGGFMESTLSATIRYFRNGISQGTRFLNPNEFVNESFTFTGVGASDVLSIEIETEFELPQIPELR